ncbi:MAG: TetM/TetW/TetO/TetS family tetracycline resistance ribosomal protection protein [Oscillospiraceae bacterium]|nr:TetM/TetW/TetO/TetS family tetracycline resistance ribosomal protection protein [Oscillospiraceae bacterium]
MKKLVIGILAHVDAGKTTLSEGLLYVSGALRKPGRVDHGNAFLDNYALERQRGITIFAKQARFTSPHAEFTLLDTPGHVDFSTEMERTLQVLDYAVLLISGTDGVQSHTRTLWRLLKRYQVPTFLFINKMDLAGTDRTALLAQLRQVLGDGFVDFAADDREEAIAMCGEESMEEYLEKGAVKDETVAALIKSRALFPCFFGSALKMEGVEEFFSALDRYTAMPAYGSDFAAQIFKISRDAQGNRLTWLKVTGGELKAKTVLSGGRDDAPWSEKADQLRLYSGEKYQPTDAALPGTVVAVTGLSRTRPGESLGAQTPAPEPTLEPVLTYRLILPAEVSSLNALPKLLVMEEEDPMLRLLWNEQHKEIHVQLMGQIQLEVLRELISERYGFSVEFDTGSIVYKETVANTVEGIGHFEPLRHYAEVHLLLEPLPRGSGIKIASACSTDDLDLNWQRLIFTHLTEREHPGVLTGSALTDVKITLLAGRAHVKHTEGGDFRQATYRAVRQGLMQAESVLLEPYYDFLLELPHDCVGRAMTDLQTMGGTVEGPEMLGDTSLLTGFAPVSALRDYWQDVTAYTRGRGRLSCTVRGYEAHHAQEEALAAAAYDPLHDTENPVDSVFCTHGSGSVVKWDEVAEHAHIPPLLKEKAAEEESAPVSYRRNISAGSFEDDKELRAIFEQTYGKVERKAFESPRAPRRTALDENRYNIQKQHLGPEYLLVDGYNIIFAWEDLKKIALEDISTARSLLIEILSNYQGFRKCIVILVFDAYKVKGNPGSVEKINGIDVVYTKEAETADSYIEKATYELGRDHRVRVATSDGLEQLIILGHGATRVSARIFREEVEEAQGQIKDLLYQHNLKKPGENALRHTARIKE